MSKFKAGDRVRVLANTCLHDQEIGSIVTLEHMGARNAMVSNRPAWGIVGSPYYISERDIERVESKSIHITTDGKTTHAVLKEGGKVSKRAKAVCSPHDEFDFAIGARIAFNRLMGSAIEIPTPAEPEKPQYYNGKVVCVDDCGYPDTWTKGRVYVFVDGVTTSDKGWKTSCYKTLEHANGEKGGVWVGAKFIEFKGEA